MTAGGSPEGGGNIPDNSPERLAEQQRAAELLAQIAQIEDSLDMINDPDDPERDIRELGPQWLDPEID
jgi:hypothetical protein